MSNYNPSSIAHYYVSQVLSELVTSHHVAQSEAEKIISQSGLYDCICGCPYIANHYPAAKAARSLLDAASNSPSFNTLHKAEEIHHATY